MHPEQKKPDQQAYEREVGDGSPQLVWYNRPAQERRHDCQELKRYHNSGQYRFHGATAPPAELHHSPLTVDQGGITIIAPDGKK